MTSKALNAGAASFKPSLEEEESSPNALSNNANSLTEEAQEVPPMEGGVRDSFHEYAEMVENIEDEMDQESYGMIPQENNNNNNNNNNAAYGNNMHTGLPPHMQNHAKEFWFADARDCSCCNGFKFGCANCGGGACKCAGGSPSVVPTGGAPMTTPHPVNNMPVGPGGASGGAVGYQGRGRGGYSNNNSGRGRGGRGGGRGGRGKIPCKFFFSPQGCRYGDSCTFDHQIQG